MATTGPKRSFFKKPSWASSSASTEKTADADLFQNLVYEDILEAQRKERAEKDAAEKLIRTKKEQDAVREPKRQRLSDEWDDDISDDLEVSGSKSKKDAKKKGKENDSPISHNTRSKTNTPVKAVGRVIIGPRDSPPPSASRKVPPIKPTVAVDDDDDEEEEDDIVAKEDKDLYASFKTTRPKKIIPVKLKKKPPIIDPDLEEEDDDEYTRELKKKAREKVRLQKLGLEPAKTSTPAQEPATSVNGLDETPAGENPPDKKEIEPVAIAPPQTTASKGPKVRLLLRPCIPNTKALIVARYASQPLKEVKDFWCGREQLDAATSAKVFLTWRDTKLFNSTTMVSILKQLKQDAPREVFETFDEDEDEDDDGTAPKMTGIELDVVTEEIYQERLRSRAKEAVQAATDANHSGASDNLSAPVGDSVNSSIRISNSESADSFEPIPPPPQPPQSLVLVLTCAGLASEKPERQSSISLRVRPNTLISKVTAGFKKMAGVEPSKTCWLVFDGERLNPEQTVQEIGLEDQDAIEVYLR